MSVRETICSSLRLLNRRDRRLLAGAIVIQMATSLLDLLGVALIGIAGVLSISAVAGQSPPRQVTALAERVGIEGVPTAMSVSALAALAAALLIAKSLAAPLLMARVLRFLAHREATVSARLTSALLSRPLTFVQLRSTQQTYVALVRGAHAATVIVLGQTVVAISDLALLAVMGISLLLVNPFAAVGAIGFFGMMAWVVQRGLGDRASSFGVQRSDADTASLRAIQEALGAYREIVVSNRRDFYISRLGALRQRAARAAAGLQLIGVAPKYVFEAGLVIGAFMLASVVFSTQPTWAAAGTFAVFLAAATRIMPALLRVQGAALSIRAAAGPAAATFSLAEDLGHPHGSHGFKWAGGDAGVRPRFAHHDFIPSVELNAVSFTYPTSQVAAIHDVTLTVAAGQSIALLGRSGSGKSTLADVLLGVLQPDSGHATISGVNPGEALRRWPGAISYVPQHVMIVEDSIRANVALGVPPDLISDELIWDALRRARLSDFVRESLDGLETQVGERGLRLSGGQRQRIGIARALLTRPRLLVLDEATSALDAETERAIATLLGKLGTRTTLVTIAHRLSTIQKADQVVYLESGRVVATGSFDELCSRLPDLRRQAELMGVLPA